MSDHEDGLDALSFEAWDHDDRDDLDTGRKVTMTPKAVSEIERLRRALADVFCDLGGNRVCSAHV